MVAAVEVAPTMSISNRLVSARCTALALQSADAQHVVRQGCRDGPGIGSTTAAGDQRPGLSGAPLYEKAGDQGTDRSRGDGHLFVYKHALVWSSLIRPPTVEGIRLQAFDRSRPGHALGSYYK